jgi:hypothetical protein
VIEYIAGAFLVISLVSLLIQSIALFRITRPEDGEWGPAHRGILRTAICRVVASILYVVLGIITLLFATDIEALLVFGIVRIMWQINAIADVRLRHRLAGKTGRHRAPPTVIAALIHKWWWTAAICGAIAGFALYLNLRL